MLGCYRAKAKKKRNKANARVATAMARTVRCTNKGTDYGARYAVYRSRRTATSYSRTRCINYFVDHLRTFVHDVARAILQPVSEIRRQHLALLAIEDVAVLHCLAAITDAADSNVINGRWNLGVLNGRTAATALAPAVLSISPLACGSGLASLLYLCCVGRIW